jgi:zinc transporter ZupT
LALLAAVTLHGVPENLALGFSIVEGTSLALLVAIFLSNLPESLVGAVAMREEGRAERTMLWAWTVCSSRTFWPGDAGDRMEAMPTACPPECGVGWVVI